MFSCKWLVAFPKYSQFKNGSILCSKFEKSFHQALNQFTFIIADYYINSKLKFQYIFNHWSTGKKLLTTYIITDTVLGIDWCVRRNHCSWCSKGTYSFQKRRKLVTLLLVQCFVKGRGEGGAGEGRGKGRERRGLEKRVGTTHSFSLPETSPCYWLCPPLPACTSRHLSLLLWSRMTFL